MLKTGHTVKLPDTLRGPNPPAKPDDIPVPAELETVPGHRQDTTTVNWYSTHYPLEADSVGNFVFRKWLREVTDLEEVFEEHQRLNKPNIQAARESGEIEPTAAPVPGKDVTSEIKAKAIDLGYAMVGITAYDNHYTYKSRRKWVKPYPHAICLAMEQPYEETQNIPSVDSEAKVFDTYRRAGVAGLELADYIRSLGYHAQVQNSGDASSAVIPMFVQAGLGQQGAMGYLLSPRFGSRVRLMLITTDALVSHDEPVDYGVNAFCSICQVCVNRCPGRALMREKVWWRGTEKFKIIAKRCRPVLARYAACGVCMKVCPIQRYGMKEVYQHYASTGQVLGKGTHGLEGYGIEQLGYFGPGELPKFDSDFFHIPEGPADLNLLEDLKAKIEAGEASEGPEREKLFQEFGSQLQQALKNSKDALDAEWDDNKHENTDPLG